MGLHIAVCHIVACDATEGLSTLRAHAKKHELTVVLFYRVAADDDTWEDVILVCEGEQPRLDVFVEMLRGSEPLLRCASTLMRQWSYTAQELHLPSERVGWGYQEWCDFAAQESYTHEFYRARLCIPSFLTHSTCPQEPYAHQYCSAILSSVLAPLTCRSCTSTSSSSSSSSSSSARRRRHCHLPTRSVSSVQPGSEAQSTKTTPSSP